MLRSSLIPQGAPDLSKCEAPGGSLSFPLCWGRPHSPSALRRGRPGALGVCANRRLSGFVTFRCCSFLSTAPSVPVVSPNTDEFLDLLASSQSRRLDDQRASFSNLPGLRLTKGNNQSVLERLMTNDKKEPDEDFFDILVKCQVSARSLYPVE